MSHHAYIIVGNPFLMKNYAKSKGGRLVASLVFLCLDRKGYIWNPLLLGTFIFLNGIVFKLRETIKGGKKVLAEVRSGKELHNPVP